MLETSLLRLANAGDRRVVLCWPPACISEFAEVAGPAWQVQPQHAGDLSVRLTGFFADAFQANATRVIAIGSDCPELDCRTIENAFAILDSNRVVLGPAGDGGYYLVGMREPTAWLFEGIDWSTNRVWEQTRRKLSNRNVAWGALPQMNDVDDTSDLIRLCARLANSADGLDQNLLSRLRTEVAGNVNGDNEPCERDHARCVDSSFPIKPHSIGGARE